MVFRSKAELESYLLSKVENAVRKSQEQIYQIIDRFVKQYYAEFTPDVYERTYQLYRSLVKSDVTPSATGKGYVCSVYFDITALDYAMKYRNGKSYANRGWSEQKTLEAAAHGSHGGYVKGTAIWDDSLQVLNAEAYNTLKRMLISEGIPLR